jgi:hypothetical protein
LLPCSVYAGPTFTQGNGDPNYKAAFTDFFYHDLVSGVWRMMSVAAVVSSPVIASATIVFGSTTATFTRCSDTTSAGHDTVTIACGQLACQLSAPSLLRHRH